jgi:formate dehydrogenase major subunit
MGLRGGERVKVSSARGHYIAKAMVTRRIKPMLIDGKQNLPDRHSDPLGLSRYRRRRRQDRAHAPPTCSLPPAIDPNAYTPEFKGFLVKLEKLA